MLLGELEVALDVGRQRVQGAALDRAYLEHHATSHGVLDLLQRALNE